MEMTCKPLRQSKQSQSPSGLLQDSPQNSEESVSPMQRETELQLRWIVKWESTGNSGHAGTLESTDNRGGSGGGGGQCPVQETQG